MDKLEEMLAKRPKIRGLDEMQTVWLCYGFVVGPEDLDNGDQDYYPNCYPHMEVFDNEEAADEWVMQTKKTTEGIDIDDDEVDEEKIASIYKKWVEKEVDNLHDFLHKKEGPGPKSKKNKTRTPSPYLYFIRKVEKKVKQNYLECC
jgi:hypothetical protein